MLFISLCGIVINMNKELHNYNTLPEEKDIKAKLLGSEAIRSIPAGANDVKVSEQNLPDSDVKVLVKEVDDNGVERSTFDF